MSPGREMNALVAERVMGLEVRSAVTCGLCVAIENRCREARKGTAP